MDLNITCQDNLELLKSQMSESVDLIYCDILYGTGRNFGDYQDLKPIRSEIEAHYLTRLKEIHRVLKANGTIYLQMDTKINHWARILMDEVFGYDNFRNEIVWCYSSPSNSKKDFPKKHDVILRYSKTKNYTFNGFFIPHKSGLHNTGKIFKSKNNDTKTVINIEKRGKQIEDFWTDIFTVDRIRSELVGYNTQKPKALIERIIKASSNEGDTVADYYLGSGTTAVVCKELNRNFIGCDINPKAIEITKKRLQQQNFK